MNEKKLIGKENRFTHYPDTLISALGKDRNSMVDSFVDEAVRFYIIMSVYPTFPVKEAIQLAMHPDNYKVEVHSIEEASRSSEWRAENPNIPPTTEGWLVTITEVNE